VIGDNNKGGTLYQWGESPDYVWKGFGDKDTHGVYKGDVENGKPNGLGVVIFPNGFKYVGGWKNGKENGKGTLTTKYGSKYVGEYKDGFWWNVILYDKNGKIIKTIIHPLNEN